MSNKTNVIVLNDKGGCGKSLVTAGTFLAAAIHGLPYKGIEAESEPRLALRYPKEFEHVTITNSEATMARDVNAALRQFDTIFEKLETGGYLIDLGANVAEHMFKIFEATDPTAFVGDGSKCAIVIVTTSDTNAIKSAIKNAETTRRVLPGAKFFLVLNDVVGKIPDAAPFLKPMKSAGFEILRIPVCTAEAWNIVSDQPLNELVAIDTATLMKFNVSKPDALRDSRDIRSFISALANSLLPIAIWAKGE